MNNVLQQSIDFLKDRFSLQRDQEREDMVVSEIRKGVEFRGINTWVLVFAIMVASIGLNVNSTAVVIGAMLISPLMGPIMGVGLGVGISDMRLIKKASKNLGVMVAISVVTSALYFAISPLQEDNSELLGRTAPTVWDVFIAMFGGLAGIVAAASKEKGNVVPGVAIATALMPPLCTAGYGIVKGFGTGEWDYFFGAFYLFSINAVFICFSTLLIVRFLRFSEVTFVSPEVKKRARTVIGIFVVAMIIPSIYIAQNLVRESIFKQKATAYVDKNFKFPATSVLKTEAKYDPENPEVEVWLRGETLDANTIANLENRMAADGLEGCKLNIVQDPKQMSADEIKSQVFERIVTDNLDSLHSQREKINFLTKELAAIKSQALPLDKLARESAQFDERIQKLSIQPTVFYDKKGKPTDTVHLAITHFSKKPRKAEVERFSQWLKVRLECDSVRVVVD